MIPTLPSPSVQGRVGNIYYSLLTTDYSSPT
jgi:hypothetical protein